MITMEKQYIISLKEGLSLIEVGGDDLKQEMVGGDLTYVNLMSLQVFKEKGCDCVSCGSTGSFFKKEKNGYGKNIYNQWHLNLYAINKYGDSVMMTKDHMLARSLGGGDVMENFTPMCRKCNARKGDKTEDQWKQVCDADAHLSNPEAKILRHEFKQKHKNINNSTPPVYKKWSQKCDITEEEKGHIVNRALERWQMEITTYDYQVMIDQIQQRSTEHSRVLLTKGKISYHMVKVRGFFIPVAYSRNWKKILSVISKSEYSKIEPGCPHWAQLHTDQFKKSCKEVIETVEKEYREFDNQMEAINYYKSCTYPSPMFQYWKSKDKEHHKFKLVVGNCAKKELGL